MKRLNLHKKWTVGALGKVSDVKLISPLNPKRFRAFIGDYGWRLVSLCLGRRGKKITNRVTLYSSFGKFMLSMYRRHGTSYVIKYLKASQLAIQRALAGSPLSSLRELEPDLPMPKLSKSGLPRVIGLRDRRAIMTGSFPVIRLYLTLFSIYRVIDDVPKPKISTITDNFTGSLEVLGEVKQNVGLTAARVLRRFRPPKRFRPDNGVQWISKASSTSKVA